MNSIVDKQQLTDAEKKKLIKEILGNNYDITDKNFPILSKVIDYIGYADTAFSFAEILPATSAVLSNTSMLSAAASGASVLSIFLFPVASLITLVDALQSGQRMYTYRAVSYAITSWAFNQNTPIASKRILYNLTHEVPIATPREINTYNIKWHDAAKSVTRELTNELSRKNIKKEHMQLILRSIGNGKDNNLCLLLLKGFENKLHSHIEKMVWKSNYKIPYPA